MGVGNSRSEFPRERTPGFGPNVIREKHRDHLIASLLLGCIRKAGLRGSLGFERQDLAIVANQGDRVIGDLLTESQILGCANQGCDGFQVNTAALLEAKRSLCFQNFEDGAVEAVAGNFSRLYGLEHGVIGGWKVSRNQEEIVASFESLYGGASDVVGEKMRQTGHVEGVSDHDSLKAELFLEQIRDYQRRNRGYMVGIWIERRNGNVRDH
jgi:hypothetical protein